MISIKGFILIFFIITINYVSAKSSNANILECNLQLLDFDKYDTLIEENKITFHDNNEFYRLFIKGNNKNNKKVKNNEVNQQRKLINQYLNQFGSNVAKNIGDLSSVLGYLSNKELEKSAFVFLRFVINSTVGVLGLFRITSVEEDLKVPHKKLTETIFLNNKFSDNKYLVLPILGPSTNLITRAFIVEKAVEITTFLKFYKTNFKRGLVLTSYLINTKDIASKLTVLLELGNYELIRNTFLQNQFKVWHSHNCPDQVILDPFIYSYNFQE